MQLGDEAVSRQRVAVTVKGVIGTLSFAFRVCFQRDCVRVQLGKQAAVVVAAVQMYLTPFSPALSRSLLSRSPT